MASGGVAGQMSASMFGRPGHRPLRHWGGQSRFSACP